MDVGYFDNFSVFDLELTSRYPRKSCVSVSDSFSRKYPGVSEFLTNMQI